MFDWLFSSRCPVSERDRAWAEQRTRWLAGEVGLERIRSLPVILPTPEFFPDPYDGSPEAGVRMVRRVGQFMGVGTQGLDVQFYADDRPPIFGGMQHGAAGLFEQAGQMVRVSLASSNLDDPLTLVATAAHELSHVLLHGQGRLSGEEPDHEQVTDLLTVVLGFGVFTANSRIRSHNWHDGNREGWSIQRVGYLTQPQVGYALALFAHVRNEEAPPWAGELCADVRSPFKQGLRYLRKAGTSLFDADAGRFAALSDDDAPPGFERMYGK
jgi:hypothetical protein